MPPVNPQAHRVAGWTRQTRTESLLLMELFLPLHLQSEQSFSYRSPYSSIRPPRLRVCWIFDYNFRANPSSLSRVKTSCTTRAESPKRRSLGSARASRAGDRARAIANFRPIGWVYRILGGGAEKCTRRACAPQITSPRWLLHVHDAFNWGWSSFLQNSYLPIAVLPALIAFPKNCKHKY